MLVLDSLFRNKSLKNLDSCFTGSKHETTVSRQLILCQFQQQLHNWAVCCLFIVKFWKNLIFCFSPTNTGKPIVTVVDFDSSPPVDGKTHTGGLLILLSQMFLCLKNERFFRRKKNHIKTDFTHSVTKLMISKTNKNAQIPRIYELVGNYLK